MSQREPASAPTPRSTSEQPLPLTFGWIVATGLVVALGTGLIQAAWLAWQLEVRNQLIWYSRDYLWMSPVSYIMPVGAAVLLAAAFAAVLRTVKIRVNGTRVVAAAALFLGAFALALLAPRIHPLAQAAIALGVAFRASVPLARQPLSRMARVAGSLAVAVAVLLAMSVAMQRTAERRATSQLTAARAGAPNVLFIILDTVRAMSMSLYGYDRATTPALERWAKDGVTFEYAISPAPWTLPSHASMFTGVDAAGLSTNWRTPLDDTNPTLAEALRDQGYMTAGFIANTYYTGHDSGLDRGFVHYEDYRRTGEQIYWSSTLSQTELAKSIRWAGGWRDVVNAIRKFDLSATPLRIAHQKRANTVTDGFLDWHARQQGDRPFFAFLNYFDAHEAYRPPSRLRKLFADQPGKRDLYDACIRYLDEELDRLFATLAQRGILDNTIVIVTSDHGEYLGERNMWGHGKGMHLEVLRVPLMIRFPNGAPAGRRIEDVVSSRDLPATVTELANGSQRTFPGRSLSRFWADSTRRLGPGDTVQSSTTFFVDGWLPAKRQRSVTAVFDHELQLIATSDGHEELYSYRGREAAADDLSGRGELADRLRALKAAIPEKRRR